MQKGQRTTKKQKIETAAQICEVYAAGKHTIESVCKNHGISARTFTNWTNEVSEIAELYKKAQDEKTAAYKSGLKELARTALERIIEGFSVPVEDETTETMTDSEGNELEVFKKRIKKTSKYFPPNVTAVIFALTNVDNNNFLRNEPKIDFASLSEQEADNILSRLAEKMKQDER